MTKTALVELSVSRTEGDSFSLDTLSNIELFLAGTAAVPADHSSSAASPVASVRDQLDDDDLWVDVGEDPTSVFLEFRRESRISMSRLPEVTFKWGSGEVAFVQTVPLNLVWTASACTVEI